MFKELVPILRHRAVLMTVTCVAHMGSRGQRPTVGSIDITRRGRKDSWIVAAARIPVRTRRFSRWRTLSSYFVPSIPLGERGN
jgi:hypothetical protein